MNCSFQGVLTLENQTPEITTTTQSSIFGGNWFTLKPSWLTLQPSITAVPVSQLEGSGVLFS